MEPERVRAAVLRLVEAAVLWERQAVAAQQPDVRVDDAVEDTLFMQGIIDQVASFVDAVEADAGSRRTLLRASGYVLNEQGVRDMRLWAQVKRCIQQYMEQGRTPDLYSMLAPHIEQNGYSLTPLKAATDRIEQTLKNPNETHEAEDEADKVARAIGFPKKSKRHALDSLLQPQGDDEDGERPPLFEEIIDYRSVSDREVLTYLLECLGMQRSNVVAAVRDVEQHSPQVFRRMRLKTLIEGPHASDGGKPRRD